MDLRKIKKLIELVEESQIASLKISENGETIEISKSVGSPVLTAPTPTGTHHHLIAPTAQNSLPDTEGQKKATSDNNAALHHVKSPMVGTVYLSPTPGSDPFVKVGQVVTQGQTLCLVEAMKMYNQIEADKSGTITACLVENASPIEFEQPLFIIE
ncbi:MAG: acetyl-CoA carboxylase biotin carboxyl carrier protein [Gammaproteobacteria bacterium]|nr:acetyl-CoA carboxylase biotin carboxyl carrier protein [Gammaproteobacteria bacterium]